MLTRKKKVTKSAKKRQTRTSSIKNAVQGNNKIPAQRATTTPNLKNLLAAGDKLSVLSQVAALCPVAVIIITQEGIIKYCNHAFYSLTKFTAKDLLEKTISALSNTFRTTVIFSNMQKALLAKTNSHTKQQTRNKSGKIYWESETIHPLHPPKKNKYYIGFLQDITPYIHSKKMISHMAFYDLLTDLPNRILFSGELDATLKHAKTTGQKLAVVLLDLDRFKTINDNLGHTIGDQLILNVATRLRDKLDSHDTLARRGGDEFMLLLPHIHNFQEVFTKIQFIREIFKQPFEFNHQRLHISVSMGISLYPEDGEDTQSLIKHADSALYEAKNSGRNHHKLYSPKSDKNAMHDLAIEMALRQALEQHHFQLFYQPQVSFKTGRIIGAEALIRLHDPELGIIMPDRFIPLAEETGLIVPVGEWVLREACAQTVRWQNLGFSDFRMAVNISVRQFQESDLAETILRICQEANLPPQVLELEITESILMKDINIAKMILQWLHKKGTTITIDDFGTGYSALKFLKCLPISTIKIDRSFIRDSINNPDDAALVTTICSIAKNLNVKVIAEGIETEQQLHFLYSLGCDAFQGYYFSRPIPAKDFVVLLQENRSLPMDKLRSTSSS
ncbi:EAL domain-containing protein [bacterium]|nr:EAL domain-containing protein [bacterium]